MVHARLASIAGRMIPATVTLLVLLLTANHSPAQTQLFNYSESLFGDPPTPFLLTSSMSGTWSPSLSATAVRRQNSAIHARERCGQENRTTIC